MKDNSTYAFTTNINTRSQCGIKYYPTPFPSPVTCKPFRAASTRAENTGQPPAKDRL